MASKPILIDFVRGDATGLMIPAHPLAFEQGGAAFLTEAFRAFGALPPDNAVAKIKRIEACPGGSTGHKLFLSVAYEKADPSLHTELFVKFSRDFHDAMRDWQRTEMEPEARFAKISRLPEFPIRVPAAYFADYEHASGTGLVITERVPFGEGAIDPHRRKCLDYQIAEPLLYYRALITGLARLAAAHKSGRLPAIDTLFPLDLKRASSDPIKHTEEELRAIIANDVAFAEQCPQLLPAALRDPDFMAQVEREALLVRGHETEIQNYLRGDPDFIALCHWNAHIDNAWFWRDSDALRCGLIDWGRVSQITFGSALWGCLSAAHHDVIKSNLDELFELFVSELRENGGPVITREALELHFVLHVAAMGVARVLDFPRIVLHRLPDVVRANGPTDSMFLQSDPARNCLHIYTVFLTLWREREFGARLKFLLRR